MFKYVHYTNSNALALIKQLKSTYNTPTKKYNFLDGKYKGNNCVFVLNDLATKEYSEPIPSVQFKNDLFFPPLHPINIDDYEVRKDLREQKIPVTLISGQTIYIIPATLEPKKLVFSFDDTDLNTDNTPYSLSTEYGRKAYAVFESIEIKKENLLLKDNKVKNLILLSLLKSYDLTIDVWNYLGLITEQDTESMLFAALGVSPELVLKKNYGSTQ